MAQKKPYSSPAIRIFGDIRTLTRMPAKDFGLSDGYWLKQPTNALCDPGNCVS
jgi:hypothetical protein